MTSLIEKKNAKFSSKNNHQTWSHLDSLGSKFANLWNMLTKSISSSPSKLASNSAKTPLSHWWRRAPRGSIFERSCQRVEKMVSCKNRLEDFSTLPVAYRLYKHGDRNKRLKTDSHPLQSWNAYSLCSIGFSCTNQTAHSSLQVNQSNTGWAR